MKKILIAIFFFFIFVAKTNAIEELVLSEEIIQDSNYALVESETRYKWYKNIIEYSPDYYIVGENNLLFPYILYNDSIATDFSEWLEYYPEYKFNREIESIPERRYRTLRPIRYLFFEDFQGGFVNFNISELNILINNQNISYNLECFNCSSNFKDIVTDDIYQNNAYINNGGRLMIDLGDYYGIEEIKIELYMYDSVPSTKKFKLYYNEGETLNDRNYAYKDIDIFVVSSNPNEPEKHLIIPDHSFITNPVWNDWIYIDGAVNSTYYRQMQFLSLYRYRDIKYRFYNETKEYLDGYYSNIDDHSYYLDEESSKNFYLYSYNPNPIESNNQGENENISNNNQDTINESDNSFNLDYNKDSNEISSVQNINNAINELNKYEEIINKDEDLTLNRINNDSLNNEDNNKTDSNNYYLAQLKSIDTPPSSSININKITIFILLTLLIMLLYYARKSILSNQK